MASVTWKKGKYPGIQFYEHETRKYGTKWDRYFRGRYQVGGERKVIGFGWSSEKWTEKKAFLELERLKANAKKGDGPTTLIEERETREAEKERERVESEKEKERSISFKDFFNEQYFPQAKADKGKESIRREELLFRLWVDPVMGEKPLRDIVPLDIERVKKGMNDKGKSPRTVEYCLAVIRQIFNYAIRHDIVSDNPVNKVKKPKYENRRTRYLTKEQSDSLLSTLKEKSIDVHDQALLSLHTGMRAGEVLSLQWSDVHFDTGHILIRGEISKSGKDRTVYMTKQVRDMLERRFETPSHELVFTDRRHGGQIQRVSHTFIRVVNDLKLNKGVKNKRDRVTFHTLRHTYASWLAISGESLYNIKELLGHSTLALTERYSHLSPTALQGTVSRFERILEKEEKVLSFKEK